MGPKNESKTTRYAVKGRRAKAHTLSPRKRETDEQGN
jgi:hypothetical protein